MKEMILIAQISLSFLCALIIIFRRDKNRTEGSISAIWCSTMLCLGFYGISNWPEPMSVKIVLTAIASAGMFAHSVNSILLKKYCDNVHAENKN